MERSLGREQWCNHDDAAGGGAVLWAPPPSSSVLQAFDEQGPYRPHFADEDSIISQVLAVSDRPGVGPRQAGFRRRGMWHCPWLPREFVSAVWSWTIPGAEFHLPCDAVRGEHCRDVLGIPSGH